MKKYKNRLIAWVLTFALVFCSMPAVSFADEIEGGGDTSQAESVIEDDTTEVDTPVENEDPAEETPAEEDSAEDPAEETPAEETPVVEDPVVETPAEETPEEETPVEETPVVETPEEETPVEETPVEETPVEETPVVETPVVETPVVETPVVETPVVGIPAEKAPVVENLAVNNVANIANFALFNVRSEEPAFEDMGLTLYLDVKCDNEYCQEYHNGNKIELPEDITVNVKPYTTATGSKKADLTVDVDSVQGYVDSLGHDYVGISPAFTTATFYRTSSEWRFGTNTNTFTVTVHCDKCRHGNDPVECNICNGDVRNPRYDDSLVIEVRVEVTDTSSSKYCAFYNKLCEYTIPIDKVKENITWVDGKDTASLRIPVKEYAGEALKECSGNHTVIGGLGILNVTLEYTKDGWRCQDSERKGIYSIKNNCLTIKAICDAQDQTFAPRESFIKRVVGDEETKIPYETQNYDNQEYSVVKARLQELFPQRLTDPGYTNYVLDIVRVDGGWYKSFYAATDSTKTYATMMENFVNKHGNELGTAFLGGTGKVEAIYSPSNDGDLIPDKYQYTITYEDSPSGDVIVANREQKETMKANETEVVSGTGFTSLPETEKDVRIAAGAQAKSENYVFLRWDITCGDETILEATEQNLFNLKPVFRAEGGNSYVVKPAFDEIKWGGQVTDYNGSEQELSFDKVNITVGGYDVPRENLRITGYKDADGNKITGVPKNVGKYFAVVEVLGKIVDVPLEILPAKLTATYAGETVVLGSEPKGEVLVSGFVGGETAATAEGYIAPTVELDASKVGEQVVSPAGGAAKNYIFVYNGGTLQVVSKTEEIPKEYTVRFLSDGVLVASQTVQKGNKAAAEAAPEKAGYTFEGWYLGEGEFDFETPINENVDLVAKWIENKPIPAEKFTVSFDSNGGSSVAAQAVEKGATATEPANPSREGYSFTGWTLDGVSFDFGTAITADITLVAQWEAEAIVIEPGTEEPGTEEPGDSGDSGSDEGEESDDSSGELPDAELPMAVVPETFEDPQEDSQEEEIRDAEIPMANVPKTGDNLLLWLFAAAASGASALAVSRKRK